MKLSWIAASIATAVLVASLVPGPYSTVTRVSSPSELFRTARIEPAAASTVRRACQNCHSNETQWPWYSRVAPVSWILRKDVSEGREFLNFSQWEQYGPVGQGQLLTLAVGQIKDGRMPPKRYTLLHPEARLSDRERSDLIAALERESARLSGSVKSNQ